MPQKSESEREVIAHFSIMVIALPIILWVLGGLIWFASKHAAFNDPMVLPIRRPRFIMYAIFLPFFLTAGAVAIVWFVRIVVVNRGAALWVEDGRLVHAWNKMLNVPLDGISSVELLTEYMKNPNSFGKYRVREIFIVRNDGEQVKLAVNTFREQGDEVVSRIKRRLARCQVVRGISERNQDVL